MCIVIRNAYILININSTRLLGRGFHVVIRNVSFLSPTDVGSHNSPPWGPSVTIVVSRQQIWRLCDTHSQHRVGLAYFELRCLRSGNVNTNLGPRFQEKILESAEERFWKKSFESKGEKLRLVLYGNISKRQQ